MIIIGTLLRTSVHTSAAECIIKNIPPTAKQPLPFKPTLPKQSTCNPTHKIKLTPLPAITLSKTKKKDLKVSFQAKIKFTLSKKKNNVMLMFHGFFAIP